jgi:hypothetical protein
MLLGLTAIRKSRIIPRNLGKLATGILDIMALLLFMSMGRDYVSELLPPTGLLFIPQVMYECGGMIEW